MWAEGVHFWALADATLLVSCRPVANTGGRETQRLMRPSSTPRTDQDVAKLYHSCELTISGCKVPRQRLALLWLGIRRRGNGRHRAGRWRWRRRRSKAFIHGATVSFGPISDSLFVIRL